MGQKDECPGGEHLSRRGAGEDAQVVGGVEKWLGLAEQQAGIATPIRGLCDKRGAIEGVLTQVSVIDVAELDAEGACRKAVELHDWHAAETERLQALKFLAPGTVFEGTQIVSAAGLGEGGEEVRIGAVAVAHSQLE